MSTSQVEPWTGITAKKRTKKKAGSVIASFMQGIKNLLLVVTLFIARNILNYPW